MRALIHQNLFVSPGSSLLANTRTAYAGGSADPEYPRRSDEQKPQRAEKNRQEPQAIQFTLGQRVAGNKNEVPAAALGRQVRKITAGKEQREPPQVHGDTGQETPPSIEASHSRT